MHKSVRYRAAYMKDQYWDLGYEQNNLSNTWYAMGRCTSSASSNAVMFNRELFLDSAHLLFQFVRHFFSFTHYPDVDPGEFRAGHSPVPSAALSLLCTIDRHPNYETSSPIGSQYIWQTCQH